MNVYILYLVDGITNALGLVGIGFFSALVFLLCWLAILTKLNPEYFTPIREDDEVLVKEKIYVRKTLGIIKKLFLAVIIVLVLLTFIPTKEVLETLI